MKRIILFAVLICFTALLSSCIRIERFERNFEDAGYSYSEDSSYIAEILLLEFENEEIDVSIYAFNSPSKVAVIIEFENVEDIDISLENNNTLISLTSKFDVDTLIKKNFLVIPIATSEADEQEIIDIFQNWVLDLE